MTPSARSKQFAVAALVAAMGILLAAPAFGTGLLRCGLEVSPKACCPPEDPPDTSEDRIQGACCCEINEVAGNASEGLAPGVEPRAETDAAVGALWVAVGPAPRIDATPPTHRCEVAAPRVASLLAQRTSLIV